MPWQQISIKTEAGIAGRLADFFSLLGALSVTYTDAEEQPLYEPLPGETKMWQHTCVTALFENNIDTEQFRPLIASEFGSALLERWQCEQIEDQVWENAWLEYFQPMKFADKLWVAASGQEIREDGTVCITLDPGLAFGTGTHATTALCLDWLASQDLHNKSIIDYGCGSGILAIAALLLGANQAYCFDIDPQALEATRCNAEKNGVANRLHCLEPGASVPSADIILANILALPLIELCSTLTALLKADAALVLSGILQEQAHSIIETYQKRGISFAPPTLREEWCRLDGQKQNQGEH